VHRQANPRGRIGDEVHDHWIDGQRPARPVRGILPPRDSTKFQGRSFRSIALRSYHPSSSTRAVGRGDSPGCSLCRNHERSARGLEDTAVDPLSSSVMLSSTCGDRTPSCPPWPVRSGSGSSAIRSSGSCADGLLATTGCSASRASSCHARAERPTSLGETPSRR
jgi:hypothetical protein